MSVKLHELFSASFISFIVLISSVGCASESVWSSSPIGRCYPSINEYMIQTFGNDYQEDENLNITNASANDSYKWVYDATPGKNITRVLFEIGLNSSCVILYIPLASTVFTDKGDYAFAVVPKYFVSRDTPPPGFPETEIYFYRNKKGLFDPVNCYHIKNRRKQSIDCNNAFVN